MSTPSQDSIRGRVSRWWNRNVTQRVTDPISRAWNTHRGTSTLKAAYAQAARDTKRMDPRVLEAIGRAKMSKADLQLLAQAQVEAAYGGRDGGLASELTARAQARVLETARSRPPARWNVVGRVAAWNARRQGRSALKAAYAQAARDVKRMDPAVREAIGRSKIHKFDLQQFSQAEMADTFRVGNRGFDLQAARAAAGLDQQTQDQQLQGHQAETPQVESQQGQQEAPAEASQAQQEAPGQESQVQAEAAGQGRSRLERAAFRLGAAAGTVSRWASTVQSRTSQAGREFLDAYNDRRQNPASENAQQNGERVPAREIIERLQAETGQQNTQQTGERVPARDIIERLQAENGQQNAQQAGQRVPARDIIERVQAENAATAAQAATNPQVKAELAETMRRGLDNTPSGFQSVPSNLNDPAVTAESQQVTTETTRAATTEATQPGTTQNANAQNPNVQNPSGQNPTSQWINRGQAPASGATKPKVTSGQGENQETGTDHHRAKPQERKVNGLGDN